VKDKPKKTAMYATRIEQAQLDAMKAVKDRTGVPVSTQIKFAIDLWLEKQKVKK